MGKENTDFLTEIAKFLRIVLQLDRSEGVRQHRFFAPFGYGAATSRSDGFDDDGFVVGIFEGEFVGFGNTLIDGFKVTFGGVYPFNGSLVG